MCYSSFSVAEAMVICSLKCIQPVEKYIPFCQTPKQSFHGKIITLIIQISDNSELCTLMLTYVSSESENKVAIFSSFPLNFMDNEHTNCGKIFFKKSISTVNTASYDFIKETMENALTVTISGEKNSTEILVFSFFNDKIILKM